MTLEGEPGIGKTRMLDELRALAEGRGHVVLSGAAAEFEREMPSASGWTRPMHTSYRRIWCGTTGGTSPRRRARPGAPSLRAAIGAGAAVADERHRVHRASSAACSPCWRRTTARVLDGRPDWSDGASSVELLAALARREPEAPVLVALGFPARPRGATSALGARVRQLRLGHSHRPSDPASAWRRQGLRHIYLHRGRLVLPRPARQSDGDGRRRRRTGPRRRSGRNGCPPAVAAAIAGSNARGMRTARCNVAGVRSGAISRRRSPSLGRQAARDPRRPARTSTSCGDRTSAPLHLPPSARAASRVSNRVTGRRQRLADSTQGPLRSWRPAGRGRGVRTTLSSRLLQGDEVP